MQMKLITKCGPWQMEYGHTAIGHDARGKFFTKPDEETYDLLLAAFESEVRVGLVLCSGRAEPFYIPALLLNVEKEVDRATKQVVGNRIEWGADGFFFPVPPHPSHKNHEGQSCQVFVPCQK